MIQAHGRGDEVGDRERSLALNSCYKGVRAFYVNNKVYLTTKFFEIV